MSKVYLKLTTGKQEALNLIDNKLIKSNKNAVIKKCKDNFLAPRSQLMNLSDYDKKEHEKFIKEMKNPIWDKIR